MNVSKELTKISFSHLKDIFKSQPALIVTILYLYFSLIGLVYATSFFREFKINIIDYFSLTDFLIITISNPQIFLYCLFTIALILLFKTKIYSELINNMINPPVYSNKILNKVFRPFLLFSRIIFYPVINLKIMMIIVILSPMLISYTSSKYQGRLILNKAIYPISDVQKFVYVLIGRSPKDYAKVRLSYDASEKDELRKLDGEYIILMTTNNYLILYEQKNKKTFAVLRTKVSLICYDDTKN